MASSLPMSVVYRHRHLKGGRNIRLLKILRPNDQSGCEFQIVETSLDCAPPYEAISYVWGETVSPERLPLQPENTYLEITSNLARALEHLTKKCQTKHLWIDQICINQQSISERNQQVRIMGEIYARSQRTLIWLGDQDSSSLHLSTTFEYAVSSISKDESFDKFSNGIHHLLGDNDDPANRLRQRSVRELLRRPWFSRAWIVQEAVLSKSATFVIGPQVFDIRCLWSIIRKVRNIEDRRKKEEETHSIRQLPGYLLLNEISTLRKQQHSPAETTKRSFFNSLSVLTPCGATSVPNDKILAFLGLQKDPRIHLELDYSIPLDELPVITTSATIHGTGSLDIFSILHRIPDDDSHWSNLPSWVPNFAQRLQAEALSFPESPTYFQASAQYTHQPKPPTNSPVSELHARGKIIDEISFRLPFTENIPPPASSRQEWDVHTYLHISSLQQSLAAIWPENQSLPTPEDILATALADGSFAFDEKERLACRDGLSKEQKTRLLDIYKSLDPTSPGFAARSQRQRRLDTTLRDHARIAWDRAMIVSKSRWRLGLAHRSVRVGDLIGIIHGSRVPLVLRRVGGDRYQLVGQCYLEGVMRGEEVGWSEGEADEFCLI